MALYDQRRLLWMEGREMYVHVADLVAQGMQAVGPNSIREISREEGSEIRTYEIIKNVPIAQVTKDQLMEALKPLRTSQKLDKNKKETVKAESPSEESHNAGYRRWSDSLKVEDVMLPEKILHEDLTGTGEVQGTHPIHGSESGRNFAINVKKNTWVCYRCHPPEGKGKDFCGGGPWELLGVREGILSCDDCYKGWRRDLPKKWAALIKRAKELGYSGPRLPGGDGITEIRRDLVRYCVEVIMGSEHIKTLHSGEILYYEMGSINLMER